LSLLGNFVGSCASERLCAMLKNSAKLLILLVYYTVFDQFCKERYLRRYRENVGFRKI